MSSVNLGVSLEQAAQRLAAGGLVAFPTETVYGLGARADDDAAVAAIFAAKGRPSEHPLIVHVTDAAAADGFADHLNESARRLMAAFWPGPVSVIVRRRAGLAGAAAGGQDSIALRCPAHPLAQALLARCAALGVPGLAAPSANRFGRVSPTRAAHVADEFGPALWVLDGGDCALGIESAIVDCSRSSPVLLRPGTLGRAALQAALGQPLLDADAAAPRAPGSLAAHYAPRARLRLMDADALDLALARRGATAAALQTGNSLAVYTRRRPAGLAEHPPDILWQAMPADPLDLAHELFAVLRDLDARGVQDVWVEQPNAAPQWDGVRDRLRRAAAA